MKWFFIRLAIVLTLYIGTFIFLLRMLPMANPIGLFIFWTLFWGAIYLFVEVQ
jgi:hypothetical protein